MAPSLPYGNYAAHKPVQVRFEATYAFNLQCAQHFELGGSWAHKKLLEGIPCTKNCTFTSPAKINH